MIHQFCRTQIYLFGFALLMLATVATAQERPKAKKKAANVRPGGAPASFETRQFRADNGRTLDYSLFLPKSKNDEKLPLVLCLHGAGGNTEAAKVLATPERQAKHPCVIMAPGCDTTTARWVESKLRPGTFRSLLPELMTALDVVVREQRIDADRIYITGQSMGGAGTWGVIAAHPERFAAAVPVCGMWDPADAPKMTRVPVWAFHGDADPTVPVDGSRRMIEAMKAAGAMPKYTEYAGVGHNSWSSAYATDELWDWVFEQKLMKRE